MKTEPKHKTHLLYMNKEGYIWTQEHWIGRPHPDKALFFCEIPKNEDPRWIEGIPTETNIQFLTLSPFYPSQRLDVSVEKKTEPSLTRYPNHPPFEGCVKYMSLETLDFRVLPIHIERTIYTVSLFETYSQRDISSEDFKADSKIEALKKAREKLKPDTIQNIKIINSRANEEYDNYFSQQPPIGINKETVVEKNISNKLKLR